MLDFDSIFLKNLENSLKFCQDVFGYPGPILEIKGSVRFSRKRAPYYMILLKKHLKSMKLGRAASNKQTLKCPKKGTDISIFVYLCRA